MSGYVGLYHRIRSKCELSSVSLDGQIVPVLRLDLNGTLDTNSFVHTLQRHYNPLKSAALRFVRISGDSSVTALYTGCRPSIHEAQVSSGQNKIGFYDHVKPFRPAHYDASFSVDRESRGIGLHHYGRDGYVLLGYDNATDRQLLPNYIDSAGLWRHGWPGGWTLLTERSFLGWSPHDSTFLPDPLDPPNRALGSVGYNTPAGGQFHNVNVVVKLKDPRWFCVSLYFVASHPNDKHVVRSMDLTTKAVIAPSSIIEDFHEGVWWSLCYNNSIRLRLQDMKGVHVSAVGFLETNDLRGNRSTATTL